MKIWRVGCVVVKSVGDSMDAIGDLATNRRSQVLVHDVQNGPADHDTDDHSEEETHKILPSRFSLKNMAMTWLSGILSTFISQVFDLG
jgi:hypothetical protein